MYCNFNYNGRCYTCQNYIKSTAVNTFTDKVVITIPDMPLCNNKTWCINVAQGFANIDLAKLPVKIKVGTVEYSAIAPCGNLIYADQISMGKTYAFKFATDTEVFAYRGGWRLCRTKHIFNCVPLTNVGDEPTTNDIIPITPTTVKATKTAKPKTETTK